jgi:hypothetical protein
MFSLEADVRALAEEIMELQAYVETHVSARERSSFFDGQNGRKRQG